MIFFDMDGTLYRTHETFLPLFHAACNASGIRPSEVDVAYLLRTSTTAFLDRVAPCMPKAERTRFISELRKKETEAIRANGRLFDGVVDVLTSLGNEGFPLGLCSNSSIETIDAVLDRCGIRSFFQAILARSEGKTKGQGVSAYLEQEQIDPDSCILVGDSVSDYEAAKESGASFIGVRYGYGDAGIPDDAVRIDNPTDIPGQIHRTRMHMRILNDIRQKNRPLIIGVNGVDTSGKSFFARGLQQFLLFHGYDVLLLHLDDFHNPRAIRSQDDSPEGYLRHAFDTEKLYGLLSEIASGPMNRMLPVLDLDTDSFTKSIRIKTTPDTVVLVEGVLLYRPPLADLFDYTIFLDVSFDEVLRRARERDVPKYGEGFLDRYRQRYIPAQKQYLDSFRPRETCDLLIDNNDVDKPFVRSPESAGAAP